MTRRIKSDRLSSVPNELYAVPVGEPISVCQDQLTHRVATWLDTDKIVYGLGTCAKPELKAQTVCRIITHRMRFAESMNGTRCPVCWPSAVEQAPSRAPNLYPVPGHGFPIDIPF